MKKIIFIVMLVAMLVPFTAAMAEETSEYLSGTWFFDGTTYSIFAVANPTNMLLNVDAAVFAKDGTFCGCGNFQLNPNGSLDFDFNDITATSDPCPSNRGQIKVITWVGCSGKPAADGHCTRLNLANATISGWDGYGDIYDGPNASSTFGMKAVADNSSTRADILSVYLKCFNLLPH